MSEQDLTMAELPLAKWRRLGWCWEQWRYLAGANQPLREFVATLGSADLERVLWGAAPGYAAQVTADILEQTYGADIPETVGSLWRSGIELLRIGGAYGPGDGAYDPTVQPLADEAHVLISAVLNNRIHVGVQPAWEVLRHALLKRCQLRTGAKIASPSLAHCVRVGYQPGGVGWQQLHAACTGDNWWQLVRGVRWQLARLATLEEGGTGDE